jgi:hypothetical protein
MPGVLSRALALRSFQGGAIIRATGPWTAVLLDHLVGAGEKRRAHSSPRALAARRLITNAAV